MTSPSIENRGPNAPRMASESHNPLQEKHLEPLGNTERAQLDQVARRLHGELRSLLGACPPTARHASGLARFLGIDRTTCQRAVFVVSRPYPGLEMLERLPGVRALQKMVEAATRAKPPVEAGVVDGLAAAIAQYQELIASLGGSLTQLNRRIAIPPSELTRETSESSADAAHSARERLFLSARDLTGRSSKCWVAVYVYRPSPTNPEVVEVLRANGLVGHTATSTAVPLVVSNFSSPIKEEDAASRRFASLEDSPLEGWSPMTVLEDFTSDPPPLVTSRQPDHFLVQAIDPRSSVPGKPVDLMLTSRTRMPHPALEEPFVEEAWALVNFPCRHLLFQVYLHPNLARSCLASLDAHLWGPDFGQHVGDRWKTRINDEAPPLQLLGSGLGNSQSEVYPRIGELSECLFSRAGLDPEGYVGFRCEVPLPLWRTGYCITFDFGPPGK